jgi:hypothetical protein
VLRSEFENLIVGWDTAFVLHEDVFTRRKT